MAPFYGWGSTASRLEPLRGGSLLSINPISYGEGSNTTPLRFFVRNFFLQEPQPLIFLTFIFML